MTYLALDVGASVVTASVWSPGGLVASATAACTADPRGWWAGVESAVAALDADLVEVEALGCSGSASPVVALAADGEPLASVDDPRLGWRTSARDFVASLLTGRLGSDPTMVSEAGWFDASGEPLGPVGDVPPQRGSTEVLGDLLLPAARRLGLRSRVPVVTGATTRVCAVEGAGPGAPLVWEGTLLVPVSPPASPPPDGASLLAGGRSWQMYVAPPALLDALAPDAAFVYGSGDGARLGLPVVHRRWPVAGCGLAVFVASGVGASFDREAANPIAYVDERL